jgi:hypothetical protein
MERPRQLAPSFIGSGTVASPRDMLRALESLETVDLLWEVEGRNVAEGRYTLVKLMYDPESATMAVNSCLFLNVASFRYLDFEEMPCGRWRFHLHGDASHLSLITVPETDEEHGVERPHLLLEQADADFESFVTMDEDDEEE